MDEKRIQCVLADHIRFWSSFLSGRKTSITIPTDAEEILVSIESAMIELSNGIASDCWE